MMRGGEEETRRGESAARRSGGLLTQALNRAARPPARYPAQGCEPCLGRPGREARPRLHQPAHSASTVSTRVGIYIEVELQTIGRRFGFLHELLQVDLRPF